MKMTMMRITGLLALVLCVAVAVCARGLSLRPVGGYRRARRQAGRWGKEEAQEKRKGA